MSAKILIKKITWSINKWLLGWDRINERDRINKRESNQIVEFESQRVHEYLSVYTSEDERRGREERERRDILRNWLT